MSIKKLQVIQYAVFHWSTDPAFRYGKVAFGSVYKEVNLCMVPEVSIGDYVMVQVGVAISVVDEAQAKTTFEYLEQNGEVEELNDNASTPTTID